MIYEQKKWITVDYNIIDIKNMSKGHIINSMNMISRATPKHKRVTDYIVYNNLFNELHDRILEESDY